MARKWNYLERGPVGADENRVDWRLTQQFRLDGGLDVTLHVAVHGHQRTAETVWNEACLSAQHLDDPIVIVTLAEAAEAADQGDYRTADDLVTLLATM